MVKVLEINVEDLLQAGVAPDLIIAAMVELREVHLAEDAAASASWKSSYTSSTGLPSFGDDLLPGGGEGGTWSGASRARE